MFYIKVLRTLHKSSRLSNGGQSHMRNFKTWNDLDFPYAQPQQRAKWRVNQSNDEDQILHLLWEKWGGKIRASAENLWSHFLCLAHYSQLTVTLPLTSKKINEIIWVVQRPRHGMGSNILISISRQAPRVHALFTYPASNLHRVGRCRQGLCRDSFFRLMHQGG